MCSNLYQLEMFQQVSLGRYIKTVFDWLIWVTATTQPYTMLYTVSPILFPSILAHFLYSLCSTLTTL